MKKKQNKMAPVAGIAAALLLVNTSQAAVVITNIDTGVKYGKFSVGGAVVLNARTGDSGWTLNSLELFADFNDGDAPAGSMTIGVWDPLDKVVFGEFDTSGVTEEGFGSQLVTANPFGIYIPANTAFSILIEERAGGNPNTYSFVGGVDKDETNVEFLGTQVVGAGFLGGDVEFTLNGTESLSFNSQADSLQSFQAAQVPEPSSAILCGLGCVGFILRRNRA